MNHLPDASQHADQHPCRSHKKRRRERMLDGQEIRLLMLHFLSAGPAHGYELIKAIEALSAGEYSPSAGLIYPGLTLLEESGAVGSQEQESGKRAYHLTSEGEALLQSSQPTLEEVIARLKALAILVQNRRIPEVEQAIHQFKKALNTRLAQEDISPETLNSVIAALADAARRIEQS